MPYYMVEVAYEAETVDELAKKQGDRIGAVRPAAEKLGGSLEGAWFAFGEYDLIAIFQMPDIKSAAAFSLTFSAGGRVKAIKTTALMTIEEGVEAKQKAAALADHLKVKSPDSQVTGG